MTPRHDGAPGGDQGQPANVTAKRLIKCPTATREKRLLPDSFCVAIRELTKCAGHLTKLIDEALTGALAALPQIESPS